MMGWTAVRNLLMGLGIGIACVTPGLSGGVIAAAAGIYEPALHAIVNVFKQFKKSCVYLAPLGIGALLGVLLFSRAMERLMVAAPFQVLYVFTGLVIGSLPALVREANRDGFRASWLAPGAVALGIAIALGPVLASVSPQGGAGALSPAQAVIGGGVLAMGTVVPGISASFILMAMGTYEQLLSAIANLRIADLALIGVGFVLVALVTVKLAEVLFRRFRGASYYAVIGLLLGSMTIAFPGVRTGWDLFADVALLAASAAISYVVMRMRKEEAR